MKQRISVILGAVIVLAVFLMGIMELITSKVGGNTAKIIIYVILAVFLIILYIRARKDAAIDAERRKNEAAENDAEQQDYEEEIEPFDEEELARLSMEAGKALSDENKSEDNGQISNRLKEEQDDI